MINLNDFLNTKLGSTTKMQLTTLQYVAESTSKIDHFKYIFKENESASNYFDRNGNLLRLIQRYFVQNNEVNKFKHCLKSFFKYWFSIKENIMVGS